MFSKFGYSVCWGWMVHTTKKYASLYSSNSKISYKKNLLSVDYGSSPLIQNPKFNNILWVSWFLCKNLSNFVPPAWKLYNRNVILQLVRILLMFLKNSVFIYFSNQKSKKQKQFSNAARKTDEQRIFQVSLILNRKAAEVIYYYLSE